MPTPKRIPAPFSERPTYNKSVRSCPFAFSHENTNKKVKLQADSTYSRYYSRNAIHFDKFDLAIDGIRSSKPTVNYEKEVSARNAAPYLIGLEIEIEAKNTRNSDEYEDEESEDESSLTDKLASLDYAIKKFIPGQAYVCNDGSLRDGCEIVTAPRTLTEIKQNYHNYYKLLKKLKRSGYQSHDSGRCGLHIHISKKAMLDHKWISLKRTLARYQTFFKAISRRNNPNSMNPFYYCNFTGAHGRFMALNTQNYHTNEFRFFRGTLKPESFLASIEVILSLVECWRTEEKPTFQKWKKSLPKWKFAHAYTLPHMPTKQVVKQLSDQEKIERKAKRALKKQQAIEMMQSAMNRIKSNVACYQGVLGVFESKVGDKVVEVNLPLEINGYTKPLRDYAYKNPQYVTLKCVTSYAEKLTSKHKVIASCRTGWGRRSEYSRITSSY